MRQASDSFRIRFQRGESGLFSSIIRKFSLSLRKFFGFFLPLPQAGERNDYFFHSSIFMTTHNLATHLSGVMPKLLKTILIGFVLSLTVVLIIALAKISYSLFLMVLSPDAIVTNTLAEKILNFFLYFGFLGLISQYFRSGYHFPLRYFIYTGITAMVRLIIVDHESATSTILFAGAILLMVIALCLILYSDKVKNI